MNINNNQTVNYKKSRKKVERRHPETMATRSSSCGNDNNNNSNRSSREAAANNSCNNSRASRRQLTTDFVEYSTLHGINDLLRAERKPIKVLWSVIFVSALLMAMYGCYAIIKEYLKSPVVVSYVIQNSANLALPDIIICPFNRFNRTFFKEQNVSLELSQILEMSFPMGGFDYEYQSKFWYGNLSIDLEKTEAELQRLLSRLDIDHSQFMERASLATYAKKQPHNLGIYLLFTDCSSLFMSPPGRKTNCSDYSTVMTSAGKCFRVPSRGQRAAGLGFGTKIILKLPEHLYSPTVNQWPNDGIAVKLAESGKGTGMDLIFVPKGSHAIMPLKATRYEFMNDPPRYTCNKDVEGYSVVACFDSCNTRDSGAKCNCSAPALTSPTRPICTPKQFFNCFLPEMHRTAGSEHLSACREKCIKPCKYWKFQPMLSFAPIPSPQTRFFTTDDEWEQLKKTIVLQVYFENLEYTLIKHYPSMTGDSFLAQLGGQVSLWVGGSILTVVQLLIFLLELCCPKYAKKRRSATGALAEVLSGYASHYQQQQQNHNTNTPDTTDTNNTTNFNNNNSNNNNNTSSTAALLMSSSNTSSHDDGGPTTNDDDLKHQHQNSLDNSQQTTNTTIIVPLQQNQNHSSSAVASQRLLLIDDTPYGVNQNDSNKSNTNNSKNNNSSNGLDATAAAERLAQIPPNSASASASADAEKETMSISAKSIEQSKTKLTIFQQQPRTSFSLGDNEANNDNEANDDNEANNNDGGSTTNDSLLSASSTTTINSTIDTSQATSYPSRSKVLPSPLPTNNYNNNNINKKKKKDSIRGINNKTDKDNPLKTPQPNNNIRHLIPSSTTSFPSHQLLPSSYPDGHRQHQSHSHRNQHQAHTHPQLLRRPPGDPRQKSMGNPTSAALSRHQNDCNRRKGGQASAMRHNEALV